MHEEIALRKAGKIESILQKLAIPINFIPWIGGGIAALMNDAASSMLEKRIKETFADMVPMIEEKIHDQEYKEEIVGAVLSASMNVGYENDARKRQYFANILSHYLQNYRKPLPMEPLAYMEMFSGITRALSPFSFEHLLLLNDFLQERAIEDAVKADEQDETEQAWWFPYDTERDKIQGGYYIQRSIQELNNQGLIERLLRRGMRSRATRRYIVTELGKDYIEWIQAYPLTPER